MPPRAAGTISQRRSLSVTPVDNLHGEAVDTSTKRAFDDLETFAERSRRADEQTTLIAGMPPLLERAVVYFVGLALVVTLLILYFGGAQTIVETKGRILPRKRAPAAGSAGRSRARGQGRPRRHATRRRGLARIDSSEANLTIRRLGRNARWRRISCASCGHR